MYYNVTSQLASSVSAASAYIVTHAYNNFDSGSFQIIWAALDTTDATSRLAGSIDGTNYTNLTVDAVTAATTAGNHVYNLTDVGYNFIKHTWSPGTVSTGTVSVWSTRKSRR